MLISRSFVVAVMFGEFIWFLNKEWQNVSVKRASDWSAHTCCAPLPALCLKHWKHTFYLTCCFVEQFSSRVVIVRSICCSSVRCSLSSSSPDGCCCQVVDHPGSEELVSITLLPFCVYLLSFYVIISFMFSCPPLKCRSEAPHSGSITTGTYAGCWRNVVFVNEQI